ncbi:MAG TPA: hypothetical protein DHU55_18255, partial [Blastocatellia bacterium]|nr:hypothetical protein [Blastocatellia bacterium]
TARGSARMLPSKWPGYGRTSSLISTLSVASARYRERFCIARFVLHPLATAPRSVTHLRQITRAS